MAVLDHAAEVIERVSYDPYGLARHHAGTDMTGEGSVNVDDLFVLIGNWGQFGEGDITRDGTVNVNDLIALIGDWGSGLNPGELSITDNQIGWCGYVFNPEIAPDGMYIVRFRNYRPGLGRWLERDPIGYVDGMNLYEYALTSPVTHLDPFGTTSDIDAFAQCTNAIRKCLLTDPTAARLWREAKRACDRQRKRGIPIKIECDSLDNAHGRTKWSWWRRSKVIVIIGQDRNAGDPSICSTLRHELTHARQYCEHDKDFDQWYSDKERAVCSEIEAYENEPRFCPSKWKDLPGGEKGRKAQICSEACISLGRDWGRGETGRKACSKWCKENFDKCSGGDYPPAKKKSPCGCW